MKLNVKGLTITAAFVWAAALFFVGVFNLVSNTYGAEFLNVMASIYPGYDGTSNLGQVLILVLYGLVDGGACGFFFAWIYNYFTIPKIVR